MKTSIFFRNFVATASIILLSFVLLGTAFVSISYRLVIGEKRESMSVTATEVQRTLSAYHLEWNLSDLEVRMVLSIISNSSGYQILLTDTTGTVVSCSDRKMICEHLGREIDSDMFNAIVNSGEYSGYGNLGGIFSEGRYSVVLPLTAADVTYGYIILSAESSAMADIWKQSAAVFLSVALIVVAFAFVVTLITAKRQVAPINEMARATHRFAKGDFSVRVEDVGRDDEVGELAAAFNAMADSLELSENMRREFIANVSHELKTPMTTITGFADGILDGTIPPEKEREYLSIISSETKRLSRLVRSMLNMSQLQSMDPTALVKGSFDICEVMRRSVLSLEKKITDKGLDIDAELPEEPIKTRGDQDSITQVAYNLIDNAIKFSDSGTTIRLSIWKQNGRAFVSVENHGQTIPPEELPLIFGRFHKTDKSRSMDKDGVGLGLYIVKTILDRHNENIYVTSRDGVTKFVFTLKLS
jgi:signal transduction histidine kinase